MLRSECGCPFAALRPTLIYGASDPHGGYGPNRFRRQAANGEPITLFGEGEEKRDHVPVEDVARLAVRILHHKSAGALNAVTGGPTPFGDIADWWLRISLRRPRSSSCRAPDRARICCTGSSTSPNAARHFPISTTSR